MSAVILLINKIVLGVLAMNDKYPVFKVVYTLDGEQFEKKIVAKGVDRAKQNVYIGCKEGNPLAEVVILRVEFIK